MLSITRTTQRNDKITAMKIRPSTPRSERTPVDENIMPFVEIMSHYPDDLITFDVRGKLIKTTLTTLKTYPQSSLYRRVALDLEKHSSHLNRFFIDRDAELFALVLRYFDGPISEFSDREKQILLNELPHYDIPTSDLTIDEKVVTKPVDEVILVYQEAVAGVLELPTLDCEMPDMDAKSIIKKYLELPDRVREAIEKRVAWMKKSSQWRLKYISKEGEKDKHNWVCVYKISKS